MLKVRAARPAFHPNGGQQILACGESVFALLRLSPGGKQRVLCLHNISNQVQEIHLDWAKLFEQTPGYLVEILTHQKFELKQGDTWTMQPYQVHWLERQ